jgi:hypothetical protein
VMKRASEAFDLIMFAGMEKNLMKEAGKDARGDRTGEAVEDVVHVGESVDEVLLAGEAVVNRTGQAFDVMQRASAAFDEVMRGGMQFNVMKHAGMEVDRTVEVDEVLAEMERKYFSEALKAEVYNDALSVVEVEKLAAPESETKEAPWSPIRKSYVYF